MLGSRVILLIFALKCLFSLTGKRHAVLSEFNNPYLHKGNTQNFRDTRDVQSQPMLNSLIIVNDKICNFEPFSSENWAYFIISG